MRTVRSISLPLILMAATSVAAFEQQPAQQAPTLRASTNVVQVDVRVFKGDQFVRGLGVDDFVLSEDGVPQKIQSAVLVGPTPAPRAVAPTSTTAPTPQAAQSPAPVAPSAPSVWVFVFDMSHLSPAGLNRTRKAVLQFLDEKWHQGDVGGVVSEGTMAHNRITSDRAELRADVAALKMPGDLASFRMDMTVEWPRFEDEFEVLRVGADEDPAALKNVVARACEEEPDECFRQDPTKRVLEKAHFLANELQQSSLSTIRTVVALSNALTRMPAPKTVVFLSEGFAIDTMEGELRDAVGDAARAGAHFYTIDARGLNRSSASSALFTQPLVEGLGLVGKTPRFDVVVDGITSLAVDTGGMIIKNENDLGRALGEIQRDAGTYYVIAYTPTNTNFDGKYRDRHLGEAPRCASAGPPRLPRAPRGDAADADTCPGGAWKCGGAAAAIGDSELRLRADGARIAGEIVCARVTRCDKGIRCLCAIRLRASLVGVEPVHQVGSVERGGRLRAWMGRRSGWQRAAGDRRVARCGRHRPEIAAGVPGARQRLRQDRTACARRTGVTRRSRFAAELKGTPGETRRNSKGRIGAWPRVVSLIAPIPHT
jgi:VWFA-related protein